MRKTFFVGSKSPHPEKNLNCLHFEWGGGSKPPLTVSGQIAAPLSKITKSTPQPFFGFLLFAVKQRVDLPRNGTVLKNPSCLKKREELKKLKRKGDKCRERMGSALLASLFPMCKKVPSQSRHATQSFQFFAQLCLFVYKEKEKKRVVTDLFSMTN